jgi:hypothetical protein
MTFDGTIHLGDVIMTVGLAAGGWILRQSIARAMGFVQRVDGFDRRIEDTAEVVDLHTDALMKAGWTKGMDLRPVSQKRRKHDVEFSG